MSLPELRDLILKTSAASKAELPYLKLASFNGKINPDNPESRCLRYDKGVVSIHGVEGDKDDTPLSFEEAIKRLRAANLRALVYTSASHTEEKPRFRVLCPTSRELPPGERRKLMARVNGVLGGALAAKVSRSVRPTTTAE